MEFRRFKLYLWKLREDRVMKTIVSIIIICLLFATNIFAAGTCNSSGKTGTSPYTAASLSSSDVQGCLTAAERGSTVILPSGIQTWNSKVTYNKALIIQGQGPSNTIIRNGQSKCSLSDCENFRCSTFMLEYTAPNEAGATADLAYTHRITGIRFDMQYQALGIKLRNTVTTFPLTNIIIDNNSFVNCWDCDTASTLSSSPAIDLLGRFYGVIHSNSFYGFPILSISGANGSTGLNAGVVHFNYADFNTVYGSSGFVFLEDNYFYSDGSRTYTGAEPFLIEQANGQNIIMRYNDFISNRTNSPHAKPWSPHHPAGGVNVGGKGGEFYGNYIKNNAGSVSWIWATPRSGRNLIFNNRIYTSYGTMQWTMYKPTSYPPTTTTTACGSNVYAPWIGKYYCDKAGQPQHIWEAYQWANKYGNTGTGVYSATTVSDGGRLTENKHYYNCPGCASGQSTYVSGNFNGTSGIGCGTAATMNAIETCTNGVGFWVPNATIDSSAASCSNINSWVGRNNLLAASVNGKIGTLYTCENNTWVEYYQPYTYPHPLRGTDSVAPQWPSAYACIGADCSTPLTCVGDDDEVTIGGSLSDNVAVTGVKCCLENGSTCVSTTEYDSMGITLTNAAGSLWNATVTTDCDSSAAYNCKATDAAGNISSNVIIAYDTTPSSDITNPTLDTAVFDGINLTLTFSEAVKDSGTYANSQWNLTVNGTPVGITCTESWNADTLTCTPASCIASGTTLLLDWNQPVGDDSITDIAGNPLADITDKAVTNNGTADCGTPTTTSLWPHDAAPPATSATDCPSNLGHEFFSTTGGHISQGCFYKHADMDGQTHIWSLWRDGVELAQKTFTEEPESGWICQDLASSVEILPDTTYRISVHTSGNYYVRTASYFATPYTNGPFTIPALGGKYTDSINVAYPTSNIGTNLWVDFTFVPTGSSTWTVTVSNVSAAGYKCNVGATRIVDNGNATDVEVEVANGWKASFSGCGSGSTVQDGNEYTYTTAEITEDCTVEVTCSERTSPLWTTP
jgi:hypothetical protein